MKVGKHPCTNLLRSSSCENIQRNINLCVDGWERRGSGGSSEDFGEGGYRSSAEGGEVLLRQISLILNHNSWCPIVHAAWEAQEIKLLTICCRAPIDTCGSRAGNFCLFVVFGGDPPTPHILIHPGCNPWSLLSALKLCVCNNEGEGDGLGTGGVISLVNWIKTYLFLSSSWI